MNRTICRAVIALVSLPVMADEGMWPPSQINEVAPAMRQLGLQMDPSDLASLTRHPLNAIVGLGYCTGSFLSPQGLVATNHHCGFGIVQYNTTSARNLIEDGFLAADFAAELPADPNQRLYVTESIREVTESITRDLDGIGGVARFDALELRSKQAVADCEREPGYRCDVYPFNGGRDYLLIKQLEIKDVRLVYAPSSQIGDFGGEVDNWMWPRHTGDFTFLRAYVGRDGKPAPFHKDNVPFRPRSWLKLDPKGVSAGDFVMVAGYPARTNRTRLAEELQDTIDFAFPNMIRTSSETLDRIAQVTKDRSDAAIRYAATVQTVSNSLKNQRGQLEGFAKTTAVADKAGEEQRLLAWIEADPDRRARYAAAIVALQAELARIRAVRERDQFADALVTKGGALYGAAIDLYKLALERRKPDAKRAYGYQQRDEVKFQGRIAAINKRYDAEVDRALLELMLARYLKLPKAQRYPQLDAAYGIDRDGMSVADLEARLDALYAGTRLDQLEQRQALFKAKPEQFRRSKDSFVQLAVALHPLLNEIDTEAKNRLGNQALYRPAYLDALIAFRKSEQRPAYPDANNSLRITYGTVRGYQPRDGVVYSEFTSLEGVLAKLSDQDPFRLPPRAVELMRQRHFGAYADPRLGTVPVNFLTDLDITGGNSGSPTLNARGEVVGLVFDANWESVSSSWVYNPALNRAIHVDVRYMLWVMDEVDQADHLLREMGVLPSRRPAPASAQ